MNSKELLMIACLGIMGGFSTTSFVASMSIGNQDLDRYFRSSNSTQFLLEDRAMYDIYNYAYLNYTDEENKPVYYEEEQARYGEGKILDVKGKLVHISDESDVMDDTACSPNLLGTLGSEIPQNIPWIALVQRGYCTFEEKVKNVYSKGAVGVIIYNDKPVMNLEKMQIKNRNRKSIKKHLI